MKAFDQKIKISKQSDEYAISVAVSDNTVIVKTVTKNELQQLLSDLHLLLKDEEK